MAKTYDLGPVTAYAEAVAHGYVGTEEQFAAELTGATAAARAASQDAEDAEAYAIGKRNGTDVPSTDPAYHNNAKYYSETLQVDDTLSVAGRAADAKAVGDELTDLRGDLNKIDSQIDTAVNNAVRFDVDQTKTDAEKTRARSNLGAASATSVSGLESSIATETQARIAADTQNSTQITKKVNVPLRSGNPYHGTSGQVLRTLGDGTTDWVNVGLPTDEQTTEAVEAWLNEHPEATTTVEDGSITESKLASDVLELISKSGSIVNVNTYGAKGNGVADDTAAIQQCVTENPHALIYFPKGCYNISAPIDCYHHTFGTYLLLGGAVIKATSQMSYMFYFHNKTKPSSVRGYGFGAHGIFGGVINAYGLAEECIRAEDDWMLKLNSTYCTNFTVCGIRATGGGLHNYSNIKCDLESSYPWSEGTTTGIICNHVDSFFTDVQIMSTHRMIELGGGGHAFSGCYFMSRINYHLDSSLSWQGIGVYISNKSDTAALATFENCYFDSHIYNFWSDGSKTWDLDINNCRFYLTSESHFDAKQTYILAGPTNVNLRVRGAAIYSRTGCDVLIGRQNLNIVSNKHWIFEQNKPNNTYNGSIFNVINLDDAVFNFTSSDNVKTGDIFMIGAISNANIKDATYKMEIGYGDNYSELIFKNTGDKFTLVSANRAFKAAFFSIFIDQTPKTATGTLNSVTYYPIYLFSNINGLLGSIKITLKPLSFKPASCYLYNDGFKSGQTVNSPFIMQAGNVEKSIYFIGDSITAGDGCSKAFHMIIQEKLNVNGYNAHCYNYGVGGTGFYMGVASGTSTLVGDGVEGIGSAKTVTQLTRIVEIIRSLPDSIPYCVLYAGTNDYGVSVPLTDTDRTSGEVTCFRAMFNGAMTELAAKCNNIILISPIRRENGQTVNNRNRTLKEYGDAEIEIAKRFGVQIIDGYELPFNPDSSGNKTAFVPDGLHPNDAGHRKIAEALYEKIKVLIA